MKKRAYAAVPLFAAALLLAPALAGAQQTAGQTSPRRPMPGNPNYADASAPAPQPMVNLTGMLKSDGAGGWKLVDQASGDEIVLTHKAKKLAEHDQSTVTVTGRWKKNDESTKTFKVSKVEGATASATESTQTPSTQSPTATRPSTPTTPSTPPSQPSTPSTPSTPDTPESPAPGTP